jgi:hypothetical protein
MGRRASVVDTTWEEDDDDADDATDEASDLVVIDDTRSRARNNADAAALVVDGGIMMSGRVVSWALCHSLFVSSVVLNVSKVPLGSDKRTTEARLLRPGEMFKESKDTSTWRGLKRRKMSMKE